MSVAVKFEFTIELRVQEVNMTFSECNKRPHSNSNSKERERAHYSNPDELRGVNRVRTRITRGLTAIF